MLTGVWLLGTKLAARRFCTPGDDDYRQHLYRAQTHGMGLRMNEWLRDRLRHRWLRIRRDEPGDSPHSEDDKGARPH
jgi:hypothetical protein